jgi:23S rRNA (guanosine2251-2'-O)-methyltransferase
MSEASYIVGLHAVQSALRNDPEHVLEVLIDRQRKDKRMRELTELAQQSGIAVHYVEQKRLDKLAAGQKHQGVIARYKAPETFNENDLYGLVEKADQPLVLALDGVTDPHNLGACLRTADAVGVTAVIAPKDRAVGLTPTVRKVASGAAERIPFVQVTNLSRALEQLKKLGLWVIGTSDAADEELYAARLQGPLVLVMGAEGKGMRRLTQEHCDSTISIPMKGQVESLNVSVATGVCLYEILRQRL